MCGKNSNGLVEWKNKDGVMLKDLNNEGKATTPTGSVVEINPNIPSKENSSEILHLASKKVLAKGYLTDNNNFVILKGSQMNPNARNSCKSNIFKS